MLRRKLSAVLVLAALVATTSCASDSAESKYPTEAEYKAAIQATADCVEKAGFEVGPVEKGAVSGSEWVYSFDIQSGEPDDFEPVYNECALEFRDEVELAYQESLRLTGEERDSAMGELFGCLQELGVAGLSEGETDSRVFVAAIMDQLDGDDAAVTEAMTCMDRYRGVWPPGDANNP